MNWKNYDEMTVILSSKKSKKNLEKAISKKIRLGVSGYFQREYLYLLSN